MPAARLGIFSFAIGLTTVGPLGAANDAQTNNRAAIVASKAYAWLAGQKSDREFQADVVWIYDFLMRKYGIPELPHITNFRTQARNGRFNTQSFSPLLHVLSPGAGRAPDLTSTEMHPIDRASFGALWCDRMDIPDDFLKGITDLAAQGGYALTHVYLALQVLKEKQCPFFQKHKENLTALENKLTAEIRVFAKRSLKITDLEIEAAAFFSFAQSGAAPEEKFLLRAIEFGEQRLNNPYAVRLKGHTIVLLLWFMLEYLNPQAPKIPFSGSLK